MNQKKLPKVAFKDAWDTRLDELCRSKGFSGGWRDKRLRLPSRTIRNSLGGVMTEKSFCALGATLGFDTIVNFKAALDATNPPQPSLFRDIQLKSDQPVRLSERPRPAPSPLSSGPLRFGLPAGDIDYIEAWNFRLRTHAKYRFEYETATSDGWPETETVFYVGEPDGLNVDAWTRFASAGARNSRRSRSEFTAQWDHVLVSCWGKRVERWDAPWIVFRPFDYELLDGSNLTLRFVSPLVDEGAGRGLASCPEVRVSAVG